MSRMLDMQAANLGLTEQLERIKATGVPSAQIQVATYPGTCPKCGLEIALQTLMKVSEEYEGWIHGECPEPDADDDPVVAAKYNALMQKIDRIMTGLPVNVRSTNFRQAPARSMRDGDQVDMEFNHPWIIKWSKDRKDRTALTLAMNLHELGHVYFSPVLRPEDTAAHGRDVTTILMGLEDQREEMLMTLMFPKAADYFRFLNARGIRRNWHRLDGLFWVLHFGRRHLYPADLNKIMRDACVKQFSESKTDLIERLITEYQTLDLPAHWPRAWQIAHEVRALIEKQQKQSLDDLDDLRKDCLPTEGKPQIGQKQKNELAKAMKELLKDEPKGPGLTAQQPTGMGAPAESAGEAGGGGKAEKEAPTDSAGADSGTGSGETEDAADKDDDDDDDDDMTQAIGNDDEQTEAEPIEATAQGGTGAGSSGTGKAEAHANDDAPKALRDLENQAEQQLDADLNDKHEALKSMKVQVNMGGKAKGSLSPMYLNAARQLAGLFREVNQDLKPTVHRNLKRGRLDARRVSNAVAQNSSRMFKRRVGDFSTDASMGVHMMIDVSSSMSHIQAQAEGAGFALARGIEMAGHLAKVSTYDSKHVTQKNWLDRQYTKRIGHGGGGTAPYKLLRLARSDFKQLAVQEGIHNHVAIVVTDGAWSGHMQCQAAIDNLVKDGVHVVLIGIGMIPKGYSGVKVLSTPNVNGLPAAMRDPLRKLAVEIARGVRKKVTA